MFPATGLYCLKFDIHILETLQSGSREREGSAVTNKYFSPRVVWVPVSTWLGSQPCVTPILGDSLPASGLSRHCTHVHAALLSVLQRKPYQKKVFIKILHGWGFRYGLVVRSTFCPSREPKFGSQHPREALKLL